MAALFLGRRKDIKKAASGPITEQVSGEQHNCCSVIGNLQNLKKLQNIFYDGNCTERSFMQRNKCERFLKIPKAY